MKVQELLDTLDTIKDREVLRPLLAKLSPVSQSTLREFQTTWDGSRPYAEFVSEQNKVIRQCLILEAGKIGQHVRKALGLPVFSLQDEV